jgi:hypothetical protein
MKTMMALRVIALLSNALFIVYACRLDLTPILALHVLLVPINLIGLWRELAFRSTFKVTGQQRSGFTPLNHPRDEFRALSAQGHALHRRLVEQGCLPSATDLQLHRSQTTTRSARDRPSLRWKVRATRRHI